MGTLVGHVAPGFGFLLIGLWHLFNHIKLHSLYPKSYISPPWFSSTRLKYLELYLIMIGSCLSIAMELFIGPDRHQPFDIDGTIPSNHLHNFEHASISFSFLIYAAFSVVLDRLKIEARAELSQLLAALAFAQQLLLFHLHSADHMGVEGQYHLLLQAVVFISLATTLLGIALPRSFMISFVRSSSIAFQGVWFIVMGFMLWTPSLVPKGCYLNLEEGHLVVRCKSDQALHRAKSLVNIQFSWYLACFAILTMFCYLGMVRIYGEKVEYRVLGEDEEEGVLKEKKVEESAHSFLHMGKGLTSIDLER